MLTMRVSEFQPQEEYNDRPPKKEWVAVVTKKWVQPNLYADGPFGEPRPIWRSDSINNFALCPSAEDYDFSSIRGG